MRLKLDRMGQLEAREILQLPLNSGQFGEMPTLHRFPRWLTGNQSDEETFVIGGECNGEFTAKADTRLFEHPERHGQTLHAGEFVVEGAR